MNKSSHYNKPQSTKSQWPALTGIALVCVMGVGFVSNASATARDEARRMHDRLAGIPPTEQVLCAMAADISAGNPTAAAHIVMDVNHTTPGGPSTVPNPDTTNCPYGSTIDNSASVKAFYSVSLKNFVTPWTNVDQTMYAPLNDYTATVIGIIRDDKDFRQVLTGDYVYVNADSTQPYSNTDNASYANLEDNHKDLSDSSVLKYATQASVGIPGSAEDRGGVTTTRAAGEAFFKDGTNRRMFRFTMINYMCRDMEQLKDTTRNPDRIRQDVSRSPGGDSSIFLNSCIGCHSGMDPMAGAYAYYDWDDTTGQLTYNRTIVHDPNHLDANNQPAPIKHKFLINASNFPEGYITTDNSWENYWRKGLDANLGWNATNDPNLPAQNSDVTPEGNGINTMNEEIANSHAFFQCQVEKVYTHVCMESPISDHAQQIATITDGFVADHSLKTVFAKTAALCSGN